MKNAYKKSLFIAVTLLVLILLLRKFGVGKYFTLAALKEESVYLKQLAEAYYLPAVLIYIGSYALIIAFAIPAVAPLTVLGGFLFNALPGLLYAMIGATSGSIIYFLFIRYVVSNLVRQRYRARLDKFNEQIKAYGYSYLLTMQLLTVIPFFVINTLAGLADVPLFTFIWTTVLGSLPLLFIYSLAGRQLGEIEAVRDILKPHMVALLIILALLALLPMVIKRLRQSNEW